MKKILLATLGAAVVMGLISMIALTVSGIFRMELQSRREQHAVRAALRGDCEGALAWSERAGRIPYDVRSICRKGRY